ncbi:hypothetical protein [Lacisediminihabitans changchengi]|uniref:Uncharacterized protein n=1 Tax=Lacisediminihabitans changchengi TaxID=2787634 RepID=A0A934SJ21_9MICO|nr:hypothetical protein [Lacisediminihabitans changchengi]MBK4346195.1 hypothetical protein [Lacisediminihabitans changchengi]
MNTGRKILTSGTAFAAGIALVIGGGAVAANASTADATTSTTTCSFAQHLRVALRAAPADLRSDLKTLKAMKPGAERRAEVKTIRAKAADGGYGPGVEAKAQWRAENPGVRLRPLPDALKTDLKSLRGETKTERATTLDTIATTALDGGYGATVETFAKAVQSSDAWQSCGS